jgi:hypothetical protein
MRRVLFSVRSVAVQKEQHSKSMNLLGDGALPSGTTISDNHRAISLNRSVALAIMAHSVGAARLRRQAERF